MKKVIATKNAPAAIGPYSQAVQVGKPPKRSRMFTLSWQRQVIASMMS